jgi:hypothetical protein
MLVFTWQGDLPPGTPEGLKLAGEEVDGTFQHGFLLYECPLRNSRYTTHKLQEIASGIAADAQQTAQLLAGERQALWTALRCSISHRFEYWMQLCYPSEVSLVAQWLDTQLWHILETATSHKIPRQAGGRDRECILLVPSRGERGPHLPGVGDPAPSKARRLWLPQPRGHIRGGLPGALEQAVPSFSGRSGICPQLDPVMGGTECFGEDAPKDSRWRVLLQGGCREGEELRGVWRALQEEEQESATWLGEEVQENLRQNVEGVGGCSGDGSTRGKVTQERYLQRPSDQQGSRGSPTAGQGEQTCLGLAPQRQALKCLASGPDSSLTNVEITEAAAAMLCLPLQPLQRGLARP